MHICLQVGNLYCCKEEGIHIQLTFLFVLCIYALISVVHSYLFLLNYCCRHALVNRYLDYEVFQNLLIIFTSWVSVCFSLHYSLYFSLLSNTSVRELDKIIPSFFTLVDKHIKSCTSHIYTFSLKLFFFIEFHRVAVPQGIYTAHTHK